MTPEYSPFVMALFEVYLRFRFFFNFRTVIYDTALTIPNFKANIPTVFVANHISWWDGFFIILLRKRLVGRSLHHSVMLQRELIKFPVLRKVGCIGISPTSGKSISSLFIQLKSFFELSSNISLAYFPQGEITPVTERPLQFKKGIERLLKTLPPCQVIPVALHIEPLQFPKPTAYIKTGSPIFTSDLSITATDLQKRIEELLVDVSLRQPRATLIQEQS